MSKDLSEQIIDNFGKKTNFYDQYSRIQKISGQMLLERISLQNYAKALDLGAGTGYFIPDLQRLANAVTCLDASEEMIAYEKEHYPTVETILGDFNHLERHLKDRYDLIVSNFSLHWSSDLAKIFSTLTHYAMKNCLFAFAFPIDGSLAELKEAFNAIGESGFINDFYTEAQVKAFIEKANLNNYSIQITTETVKLVYPSVLDTLRSITKVGAQTNINEKKDTHLTRELLQKLIDYVKNNSGSDNVFSISWRICFIIGTHI